MGGSGGSCCCSSLLPRCADVRHAQRRPLCRQSLYPSACTCTGVHSGWARHICSQQATTSSSTFRPNIVALYRSQPRTRGPFFASKPFVKLLLKICSNSHFGSLRGKQPQSRGMTVPEPPGSAAILAASGAGETPALPGKARSEVRYGVFLFKMRIAERSGTQGQPGTSSSRVRGKPPMDL